MNRFLLALFVVGLSAVLPTSGRAQVRPDVRRFEANGISLRYADRGTGEAVILLHGFGARLEFWDAVGVGPALRNAGFRVISYDRRGHGESSKPTDLSSYGEEDLVDVIRLLDHLAVERAHLVAYSAGSIIASELAVRYPQRFRSVVFGGWAVGNPVEAISPQECVAAADGMAAGTFPPHLLRAIQGSGGSQMPAATVATLTQQVVATNDVSALAAVLKSGCNRSRVSLSDLRASQLPFLALIGELDGVASAGQAMNRDMPNQLELVILSGANHLAAPRHPDFVTQLVRFLRAKL